MNNKLVDLIDDIEILLKQDKRFYLSNDHAYRNKIKDLVKTKNFNSQPIDITPLINLAKLQSNTKSFKTNIIIKGKSNDNLNIESLKNVVAKLSELNNKMDKIVN